MREFDYYCFAECNEAIIKNDLYERQVNLGFKIGEIINDESELKVIERIFKYILLLIRNKKLRVINHKTLDEYIEICHELKPYVEKTKALIDYLDGLYIVKGYTFFGMYQKEIEEAIRLNKFLVWDDKTDNFYNINRCRVNISGKKVFARGLNPKLNKKIEEKKGIPTSTRKEQSLIINWPSAIKVDRDIKITSLRQIQNKQDYILANYTIKDKIFIKTLRKGFADTCLVDVCGDEVNFIPLKTVEDNSYSFDKISPNDRLLISKPIRPTKDEHGLREWRAFVIDNQLQSISRRDATYHIEVEHEVLEFAKRKIKENTDLIPGSYVMDVMEYFDENNELKLDIVEFNNIVNAYAFFDNNIVYGKKNPKPTSINHEFLHAMYEVNRLVLRR